MNLKLVLGLVVLGLVVLAWATFQGVKAERDEARQALARTRDLLAAAQNQLALDRFARDEGAQTERVTHETRVIVADAERAITDAAQRQDAHAMFAAYSAAVDGLREYVGGAA